MRYLSRIARNYPEWQQPVQEQFAQLPPSAHELMVSHLGKNIGAYGELGAIFYTLAGGIQSARYSIKKVQERAKPLHPGTALHMGENL